MVFKKTSSKNSRSTQIVTTTASWKSVRVDQPLMLKVRKSRDATNTCEHDSTLNSVTVVYFATPESPPLYYTRGPEKY